MDLSLVLFALMYEWVHSWEWFGHSIIYTLGKLMIHKSLLLNMSTFLELVYAWHNFFSTRLTTQCIWLAHSLFSHTKMEVYNSIAVTLPESLPKTFYKIFLFHLGVRHIWDHHHLKRKRQNPSIWGVKSNIWYFIWNIN